MLLLPYDMKLSPVFFPSMAVMCFHYYSVYFANFVKALCRSNFRHANLPQVTSKEPWQICIYLVLHALAWNQDFTVCCHNYCLMMLTAACLTFCSTGESSVHPWLAAHCTHIYRPSTRRCVRAAGWKFPRGSEEVSANMCWWIHVAQWESCCFSCLFPCLERNFWFSAEVCCVKQFWSTVFSAGASWASCWPLTSAFILCTCILGGFSI